MANLQAGIFPQPYSDRPGYWREGCFPVPAGI